VVIGTGARRGLDEPGKLSQALTFRPPSAGLPDAGSGLAEQLARLPGKFLSAAEMLWSGHRCSVHVAVQYRSLTAQDRSEMAAAQLDVPKACRSAGPHFEALQAFVAPTGLSAR
jgi:hypothetical protein